MSKDTFKAWNIDKRPIYSRMPKEQVGTSYNDYIATDWLLSYWDKVFIECYDKLEDLPRQFNPLECDEEYLDFLAPLCGWSEPYWSGDYPPESKRQLLANSYSLIWKDKGSLTVLSFVLNALFINHIIFIPGSFILGYSQLGVDELGASGWEFEILLPVTYAQNGYEFRLTRKIASLFSPLWCKYQVRYDDI
ncbi:tail protein [Anabaena phage Elbi]|nr:tail protein [Anabaena phage Elbi]